MMLFTDLLFVSISSIIGADSLVNGPELALEIFPETRSSTDGAGLHREDGSGIGDARQSVEE